MPFQSEKQRRYLWANEPEIARDWTNTYGNRIQKNDGGIMGWADQGGMKNYMGEQPMVNAPQNWRAGPNTPPTELAYVTRPERDLILQANMHGSLGQGPNEGPSGIMSLDSQGDYTQDRSPGSATQGRSPTAQANEAHMRSVLTGQQNIGQTAAVSDRTREHAVPEYARGPDGKMKYIGSGFKSAPSFFNPQGYRSIYNKRGGFFGLGGQKDIQFNKGAGEYQFKDPRTGNVKPGYGGRILGGLSSLLTGIPFVGGAIGSAIDYGKGIFGQTPRDMSQFQKLGLFGQVPEDYNRIEYYNRNNIPMDRIDPWTNVNQEITNLDKDYIDFDKAYWEGQETIPVDKYKGLQIQRNYLGEQIGSDLVQEAGLTDKQKELLDQRKHMLETLGDQAILDTITSEDDPDDPATLEDVRKYYGIDT